MRRVISSVTLVVGLLALGACSTVQDAARQAAGRVECGAATKLAERLPAGDDLDAARMTQGAEAARRIGGILGRIPGDRVPVSVTDALSAAADELDAAASAYAGDPAAAKARAAAAIAAVRTAVTDATNDLGC